MPCLPRKKQNAMKPSWKDQTSSVKDACLGRIEHLELLKEGNNLHSQVGSIYALSATAWIVHFCADLHVRRWSPLAGKYEIWLQGERFSSWLPEKAAPTPTYLSDRYYHVLMREWNLAISGVKRTKTYQDDVWTLLTALSISAAFGFPERLDRSEERQMSFKSELEKSHEVANWKHTWDHEMGFACFCCES